MKITLFCKHKLRTRNAEFLKLYIQQKQYADSHDDEKILIEHDILIFYLLFFLSFDDILEVAEEFIEITFLEYSIKFSSGLFGHVLQKRYIDTGLHWTSPFVVANKIIRLSYPQCKHGNFFLLDNRKHLHRIISFVAVSICDKYDNAWIFWIL